MFDKAIKKNQSGVLLLLSLVMTSVILVAALVLSTLAIREARLSTTSDRANTAYLGSEGAAEEVLYRINKEGLSDPTLLSGNSTTGNGVEITRTVQTQTDQFIYDFVAAGESVVINLYNLELANQAGGVSAVKVSTKSAGDIDYSLSQWDGEDLTEFETGTFSGAATLAGLNPTLAYALVIAPRGQNIIELTVLADTPVDAPTTVYVEGEYEGGQQAVQLILPKSPPWQGGAVVTPVCGNTTQEVGEECDDGNTSNGDGCSAICQIEPICGNGGAPEAGEQCDDGNTDDGDGCSATCQLESTDCGNGIQEFGEVCDDGDIAETGTCNSSCTALTSCGDGTIQDPNGQGANEECDDGNTSNGDGCDFQCQNEAIPPPPSPSFSMTIDNLPVYYQPGQTIDFTVSVSGGGFYPGDILVRKTLGGYVAGPIPFNVSGSSSGSLTLAEAGVDEATNYTLQFAADAGGGIGRQFDVDTPAAICGNNIIEPGEECDGTDVSVDSNYSPYVTDACSPSCTYNTCITANFSNATFGINASTPFYPDDWSFYVWNNPWPVVNGVTYSTLNPITNITGVCASNCTGWTARSNPAYSNGGINWRVSTIGTWDTPQTPATPPSPRYNGTLQFCRP